jgi:hypothetical protein
VRDDLKLQLARGAQQQHAAGRGPACADSSEHSDGKRRNDFYATDQLMGEAERRASVP